MRSRPGPNDARSVDPAAEVRALLARIDAGDRPGLVEVARAVPDGARPAVLALLAQACTPVLTFLPDGPRAGIALASAALESRAVDAAGHLVWLPVARDDDPFLDPERWADAVAPRGRVWCTRLVRALLSGEDRNAAARWRWVDALVRRDVVARPSHANDVLWALRQPWSQLPDLAARSPRVAELLDRVLATPGVGREVTYAPLSGGWPLLLHLLGADTTEGRARVLDEVLAGLLGALPETDSEGLALLADALGPTDDELAPRQAEVLDLLLARRPAVAALARAWAQRLVDARSVDGDTLLTITPDVLALERKNAVLAHLSLLQAAVTRGIVDASATATVLVAALDTSRTDVVVRVARLLGTLARSLPRDAVAALRDEVVLLVPEPWQELRRALGPVAPAVAVPSSDTPSGEEAARPHPVDRPLPVDLPAPGRVEPVTDIDELVALAARLLVDASVEPLELERALDGMARLRGLPRGVAESFVGRGDVGLRSAPDPAVVDVVRAWAGLPHDRPHGMQRRSGTVSRPEEAPPGAELDGPVTIPATRTHRAIQYWRWECWVDAWGPLHLGRRRLDVACLMAAGAPAPTLAAPTRDDGTLDLDTFLARTAARAAADQPFWGDDVGTALLRLPPADRTELLRRELPDGTRAALDVLDRPQRWERRTVTLRSGGRPGAERELWVAQDPSAGGPQDPVRSWLDTATVADGWTSSAFDALVTGVDSRVVARWALTLPGRPDLLAVHLQPMLIGWVDDQTADLASVVAVLGRSRTPLGSPSAAALVWAASARSATTRAAAAEAIAGAARTGMLPGERLGAELASLIGPDAAQRAGAGEWLAATPTVTRVAATLADAARIDEHGEVAALDAVLACLGALPDVRNGAALLEIAATIATRRRVRVELPEPLVRMAAGRSSTRLAQEARRAAEAGR